MKTRGMSGRMDAVRYCAPNAGGLFDRDEIADHPQFQLFELRFPSLFEGFHPGAILRRVWQHQ
jgi:hypothetical protein